MNQWWSDLLLNRSVAEKVIASLVATAIAGCFTFLTKRGQKLRTGIATSFRKRREKRRLLALPADGGLFITGLGGNLDVDYSDKPRVREIGLEGLMFKSLQCKFKLTAGDSFFFSVILSRHKNVDMGYYSGLIRLDSANVYLNLGKTVARDKMQVTHQVAGNVLTSETLYAGDHKRDKWINVRIIVSVDPGKGKGKVNYFVGDRLVVSTDIEDRDREHLHICWAGESGSGKIPYSIRMKGLEVRVART